MWSPIAFIQLETFPLVPEAHAIRSLKPTRTSCLPLVVWLDYNPSFHLLNHYFTKLQCVLILFLIYC